MRPLLPGATERLTICSDLCTAEAMTMVENADELMAAIAMMHKNKVKRQQQVEKASKILAENRGVVDKYVKAIDAILRA